MGTWWLPGEDMVKLLGTFSSSAHTRFAHRVQSQNTPCCMEMLSKAQEGLSLVRPLQSMGDVIRFNLPPPVEQSAAGFLPAWLCVWLALP